VSSEPRAEYCGHENLEVMEEAVHYNRWLAALANAHLPARGQILDFGAGTGTLTRLLAQSRDGVLALEPDAAQARRLESAGIPVVRSLAELPDASLDGIVSFNVLEHIDDDLGTMRTLTAKLRPGGVLFAYVPAFALLYGEMDRKVGHVRRYRRGALRQLAESSGLRILRCRYADSLGFFAALALRVFGARDGSLNPGAVRFYDRLIFPLSRLLDSIVGGSFGKNVYVTARRQGA
jgi:SAM-dependent methyltransferase